MSARVWGRLSCIFHILHCRMWTTTYTHAHTHTFLTSQHSYSHWNMSLCVPVILTFVYIFMSASRSLGFSNRAQLCSHSSLNSHSTHSLSLSCSSLSFALPCLFAFVCSCHSLSPAPVTDFHIGLAQSLYLFPSLSLFPCCPVPSLSSLQFSWSTSSHPAGATLAPVYQT